MASLAHLGALAVVVEGPGLEKALLEGPSQRWVVPVVAVALAEPTPSAGQRCQQAARCIGRCRATADVGGLSRHGGADGARALQRPLVE